MLTIKKIFNYYRRYRWTAANFTDLQNTVMGFQETVFGSLGRSSVLQGYDSNSSTGLVVGVKSGVAINQYGDLLAFATDTTLTVQASKKSLIVARPVKQDTHYITRPTSPGDSVPLSNEQSCQIVAIAGTSGAYPSKVDGDVVLFGVVAGGSTITSFDASKCELIGKDAEIRYQRPHSMVVGNKRYATHLTLADAVAAATGGERIRVIDSQTVDTAITVSQANLLIDFDPGVVFTKGSAATGMIIAATGVEIRGGRMKDFSGGSDVGIGITSNYCSIVGTKFKNCTNDVSDVGGTSSVVGVIEE